MGVKHPRPHKATEHKTHHKVGYHKQQVNPTTNYPKDTHKKFCDRCISFNGHCPESGSVNPSKHCSL